MCELLFVWVEKYHSLHQQGLHFSNKYVFDFQLSNMQLSVEHTSMVSHSFFGETIRDAVLVTGKNGSGKSNILSSPEN